VGATKLDPLDAIGRCRREAGSHWRDDDDRLRSPFTVDQGGVVPLYMDVHNIEGGVSAADVADAHMKDVETQRQYGVDYKKYWVDEAQGKVFCLVEAPDAETAHRVHKEAHGLVADEIYEVHEGA
jgi:hypothetical protein